MPLFVLLGRDGPRGLELRKLHREAHLKNLTSLEDAGRVRFAGPILDDDSNPCGSVVIFEADDLAAARAFVDTDPYVEEGVFETAEVFGANQVFPKSWWG